MKARLGLLWLCGVLSCNAQDTGWGHYGGDIGGSRYSPDRQINPRNIARLKEAWVYHTHALEPASDSNRKAAFEATPILFEGLLYLSTPYNQVIALDPASGAERWKYDPKLDRSRDYSEVTSRGVSAWRDSKAKRSAACASRIFEGTLDARLIALDAITGKTCQAFGNHGQVDLTKDVNLRDVGNYQVTSPPVIVGEIVIVGSSIGDNRAVELERGIVRGFDARTGVLRWSWDPIPWARDQKIRTGAGNAWAPLSADPERDLAFIPTGSASPDYYGGFRPGDDKWANSVVASRASTGEFVWGFQTVHHDLWDYDVAAQPSVFAWGKGKAVAVATKTGMVFLLDELTGKPIYPIDERPVPQNSVSGEETSATQPFSSLPALVPQRLGAEEIFTGLPAGSDYCAAKLRASHGAQVFTPPSVEGIVQIPGGVGGVNWGSVAVAANEGLLVANTNNLPFIVRMIPQERWTSTRMEARNNRLEGEFGRQQGAPFAMFRDPLILREGRKVIAPCIPPPWGTVVALDLRAKKIRWQVPLGTLVPGQNSGSINLGGPIVTAGGLVITGAAMDNLLRVFDLNTGTEIWKTELPASAQATPMTYIFRGKQYIEISAGGHGKLGTKQGDAVVALALP